MPHRLHNQTNCNAAPTAMLYSNQCLQTPKWPIEGSKMAKWVWNGTIPMFLSAANKLLMACACAINRANMSARKKKLLIVPSNFLATCHTLLRDVLGLKQNVINSYKNKKHCVKIWNWFSWCFGFCYAILMKKTLQQFSLFLSPYLLFKTCQSNLYDNLKTNTSIECFACLCFLSLITQHNTCSQNTQWQPDNLEYAFLEVNISLQASYNNFINRPGVGVIFLTSFRAYRPSSTKIE